MYAVIQTGGKQYKVAPGNRVFVEKIVADAGSLIELDRVLMIGAGEQVVVGSPYIEGGKVTATVREHGRAKKVKIIKLKRRKHYLKHQGHRQYYTLLEITGINAVGLSETLPVKSIENGVFDTPNDVSAITEAVNDGT
jgi:large subunit ribosomal protein L21